MFLTFLKIFLASFNVWILFWPLDLKFDLGYIALLFQHTATWCDVAAWTWITLFSFAERWSAGKEDVQNSCNCTLEQTWLALRSSLVFGQAFRSASFLSALAIPLVPEQSCPFCSYSLTLEHLTLGCEFVDTAVCCESVVSYGWEYFLQPSMDLGSWELRFFMSGRALLRSSLHYNKDAGCSKVFPPSNLLRFSIPWTYWNLIALPLRPTLSQVGGMPRGTDLFVPFGPPAQGAT